MPSNRPDTAISRTADMVLINSQGKRYVYPLSVSADWHFRVARPLQSLLSARPSSCAQQRSLRMGAVEHAPRYLPDGREVGTFRGPSPTRWSMSCSPNA
jgi:hypothetical protein